MTFFENFEQQPEDAIFGLNQTFKQDGRVKKVNLCVGSYQNSFGNLVLLKSVEQAEQILAAQHLIKDYLPIIGDTEFIRHSNELIFGADHPALVKGLVSTAQTPGGTGALRIGGELLSRYVTKDIYLSSPTWPNHPQIFSLAGFQVHHYPYYNETTKVADFNLIAEGIEAIPEGSVILLQGCCHNPTGLDPTLEQWKALSELVKKKKLIPFFDLAYQGLGDRMDEDATAIRLFAAEGHEMLVAYSYSKNFGLYGERVGALAVVSATAADAKRVESNLKRLIRGNYSNPPTHGIKIVCTILNDPTLKDQWLKELASMRERIQEMRKSLVARLQAKGRKNFNFMQQQRGMFSYSGLDQDQVHRLRLESGIYMPKNGRINVAGLNGENIDYVVDAILSVTES